MKSMNSIFPKHLHALWSLFNHKKKSIAEVSLDKSTVVSFFEGMTDAQYDILNQVSKTLEFTEDDSWNLTKIGTSFTNAEHWRLWKAPKKLSRILNSNNLTHCIIPNDYKRQNVIDLFAGVGGITKGFEQAGFQMAVSIDNDDHACEAHQINFPTTKMLNADIFRIAESPKIEINKLTNLGNTKIHGVVGGPPCQGFSYIGERVTEDERNLLTSKFMDVVIDYKPDFFVMENVPGLANAGTPPKFSVHIQRLSKSIGEPASILVDSLPSVPKSVAARDAQYRKRVISGSIKEEQEEIHSSLLQMTKESLLDTNYVATLVEKTFLSLQQKLNKHIISGYSGCDSGDDAAQSVINKKKEIAIISITSVLAEMLNLKVINDKNCEEFLKVVSTHLSHAEYLKETACYICKKYDSAPQGGVFKNKTIGPILKHLIDRVEPFYEISQPTVLNAATYGCPQARQRLFLIGIKKEFKKTFEFPQETHTKDNFLSSSNAIDDLPDIDCFDSLIAGHEFPSSNLNKATSPYQKYMRLEEMRLNDYSLPSPNWNPYSVDCNNRTLHAAHVIERIKLLEPGTQDSTSHKSRLHPEKPSHTLRAGTKGNKGSHTAVRPIHYKHDRVISVREGGRIMGYPDWMTFHKTKWHGFRLVGNGVPAQLSHAIAAEIKKLLYIDD